MDTTAKPAPFSLLDAWDTHLKFDGRAPRTLEELTIARAEYKHRARMTEIKRMARSLAELSKFLQPLADRGIQLQKRSMHMWGINGKELRIDASICTRDDKLLAALIELGFKEVKRQDYGPRDELVTLKHGRSLLVMIEVSKPEVVTIPPQTFVSIGMADGGRSIITTAVLVPKHHMDRLDAIQDKLAAGVPLTDQDRADNDAAVASAVPVTGAAS